MNQYGGPNTIAATDQDGYATGTLQSFNMGNDGTLTGVYSNGQRQSLGQVLVAGFNNPAGLEKSGSSTYRAGVNAGNVQIGLAGTSGRGKLSSGALEMSNVDLGMEFTNLIVAQRGFQATTRLITASDEILQDVVNLKR
jgi:flagellar hook protein FlgE